jgi:TonB family protein
MKLFLVIILLISAHCFAQNDTTRITQTQPEFPGGDSELMPFIRENIRPKGAEGKVFVVFVVDTDGSVVNVDLHKGLKDCSECDKEALRVVNLMPKWSPGKQNSKAVKVRYIIPILFKQESESISANYYNKGMKKLEREKYEEVIVSFDTAIKANPWDNIDSFYYTSLCLLKLNKT